MKSAAIIGRGVLFAVIAIATAAVAANAATLTVTSTADSGAGTLRNQIAAAVAGDTINFNLAGCPCTITLTSGEIFINKNLTITGPGASLLTISGNNNSRIFYTNSANVTISSVTLTRGNGTGSVDVIGGAILGLSGVLTVNDAVLTGNDVGTGPGSSAGIAFAFGTLNVNRTTVSGNTSDQVAGIYVQDATANITNSSITSNFGAKGEGLRVSSLSGGTTSLSMTNTTISGNSTQLLNSAIRFQSTTGSTVNANITNCTITDNTTSTPGAKGAVWLEPNSGVFNVTITNSIISGNTVAGVANDIEGTLMAGSSYNLIGTGGGLTNGVNGNIVGVNDPKLGPLGNNGGTTQTHLPLSGSPVIDKGKAVAGVTTDQRGRSRPFDNTSIPNAAGGNGSDIGAVEVEFGTVTNTNDTGAGSLRNAVNGTADIVNFNLAGCPCTIPLTSSELALNQSIEIDGPGADQLTISGGGVRRIFSITAAVPVTIRDVTLTGGGGTGALFTGQGGAILNNGGDLDVVDSVVSGSSPSLFGGAINNNAGSATFLRSTLNNNSGANGGAIFNSATLSVISSTISGNTARGTNGTTYGGGIFSGGGTVTITNSTITNNTAPNAIGNAGGVAVTSGTTTVKNTIIAANTNNRDVNGTFTTGGFNLLGNSDNSSGFTAATDIRGTTAAPINPRLTALQNNGGRIPTHGLRLGSPALDKGGAATAFAALVAPITTDQRGQPRVYDDGGLPNAAGGNGSDIGAFELQTPTAAGVSISGQVVVGKGQGLRNAIVVLTAPDGTSRTVNTGTFGNFRFDDVEIGKIYVIQVVSKRFTFMPQVVEINDKISDIVLFAQE